MGYPPDSYDLAELIEGKLGLIPVTNEYTDTYRPSDYSTLTVS